MNPSRINSELAMKARNPLNWEELVNFCIESQRFWIQQECNIDWLKESSFWNKIAQCKLVGQQLVTDCDVFTKSWVIQISWFGEGSRNKGDRE